jgi:putative transposase
MRYPAFEKLEIIRTVETSPLPVRRTLTQIGLPKSTFYAWLDRHATGGFEALEDRKPRPERVWNRIQTMSASGSLNSPSTSPSCRRARSQ